MAHEDGVTRAADGNVEAVDAQRVVELVAGDVVCMKGGLWGRGHRGQHCTRGAAPGAVPGETAPGVVAAMPGKVVPVPGAAHRAPAIGPVPTCTTHRLMLKVDVCEDF